MRRLALSLLWLSSIGSLRPPSSMSVQPSRLELAQQIIGEFRSKLSENGAMNSRAANILAMQYLRSLDTKGLVQFSHRLVEVLTDCGASPDSFTYAMLMTQMIKNHRYSDAIAVYDQISEANIVKKDRVCFVCYARAIGGMPYSFEEWRVISESLLESTKRELVGSEAILSVAETLLTNLKFVDKNNCTYEQIQQKIEFVMGWLTGVGISPTVVTLDALLSIACTQGTIDDISQALLRYSTYNLSYSQYTFNTLLNRYANDANTTAAFALIDHMHSANVHSDITTLNTLIKLFIKVKNLTGIKRVFAYMEEQKIPYNAVTKALLLQYYRLTGDHSHAMAFLQQESNNSVTPFLFSIGIPMAASCQEASQLLERAFQIRKADAAVFTAAAKVCADHGEFEQAMEIIDRMRTEGLPLNKFVLSFVISTCLQHYSNPLSAKYLRMYLKLASIHNLQSNSLCQKVVSALTALDEEASLLACQLHIFYLEQQSCKTETLTTLFSKVQSYAENTARGSIERQRTAGYLSKALLELYAFNKVGNKILAVPSARHRLLRIQHFNSVLRTLIVSQLYSHAFSVFYILRDVESEFRSPYMNSKLWVPSTFTIAELVRLARLTKNAGVAYDVVMWAVSEGTFIPIAVISDAIALLYESGASSLVFQLYQHLYLNKYLNHWTPGMDFCSIDVHGYNQGMTYAAVTIAVKEIIAKSIQNSTFAAHFKGLTVITGTNLAGRQSPSAEAFKLSSEVQRALVENFLPPISSSTVPGNPGRIQVWREDILRVRL